MVNWLVIGIGDITRKRVIPAILAEERSVFYGVVTRDPKKAEAYPGVARLDFARRRVARYRDRCRVRRFSGSAARAAYDCQSARRRACAVREAGGHELFRSAATWRRPRGNAAGLFGVAYYHAGSIPS